MKRGCLLRSVIYIVFIAGILVYLVEKYGVPVYESSKQKIEKVFLDQLQSQIIDKTTSSFTDSIKSEIAERVNDIKTDNGIIDTNKLNKLVGDIKDYLETHSDDIGDISKLKEIIIEYEQGKAN